MYQSRFSSDFRLGTHQWYQSRRSSTAWYGGDERKKLYGGEMEETKKWYGVEFDEMKKPCGREIEEMDEEYEIQELESEVTELKSKLQSMATELKRMLEESHDRFMREREEMRTMIVEKFGLPTDSYGLHHAGNRVAQSPLQQQIHLNSNFFQNHNLFVCQQNSSIQSQSTEKKKNLKNVESADETERYIDPNSFNLLKRDKEEKQKAMESDGYNNENQEVIEGSPSHFAIPMFDEMPNRNCSMYSVSEMDEKQVTTEESDKKIEHGEGVEEKNMRRDHQYCGNPNHSCCRKEQKNVKIENDEPDREMIKNEPVVPFQFTIAEKLWSHSHTSDSLVMTESVVKMTKAGCKFIIVPGVDFVSENVCAILDHAGFPEAFAKVPNLNEWYGSDTYMGATIMELFQQMTVISVEKMNASNSVGMKWHLSVTKQSYMPLPPPEPPPGLPRV